MENEAKITLGGKEYPLFMSVRAVKEISEKYGGLEKLGESMANNSNIMDTIDDVVWLIILLANQPIMTYNRAHIGEEKPLLTIEDVELMAGLDDLEGMQDAILLAMSRGTSRSIVSEQSKNA
ncbi:MAG: hypothetical protein HDT43_00720 [Ruminococcaceae bacterium]|nr:hypothetical protein [Oscillospiraceae bacterium]